MFRHAMIEDMKKYSLIKKSMPYVIGRVVSLESKIENRQGEEYDMQSEELSNWRKIRADSEEFIRDMDYCLSQLSHREEQSLRRFFIDRSRFYVEDLELEWNVERTTVYNVKNRALDKMTFMWYGYQKDDGYRNMRRTKQKEKQRRKK